MAKYAAEGERVISVTCSSGGKGWNLEKESSKIKKRRQEVIAADKILGCSVSYLMNLPDAQLPKYLRLKKYRKKLHDLIEAQKPKIIFTHCIDDPHTDHRAVAQLSKELAESFSNISVYSFTIASPLRILGRNKPRIYVDVSEHYEKKLAAAKEFKSQQMWLYYYITVSRIMNKLAGWKIGVKHAEMFYSI